MSRGIIFYCFFPLVWVVVSVKTKKAPSPAKIPSTPELLYSIDMFFFSFLNGTVWGVVGHKHQCAFFCDFFSPEGIGEGGVIVTSHIWTISNCRRETCMPISQRRGWLEVWAVQIWLFSFLRRRLKTQQSARYFSPRVPGTQKNQVAIYLETYFIKKTKNKNNSRKNCLLYIDILFNFIFLK